MMTSSWQKLLYRNCLTSPLNGKTLRDFLDAIRDDIIVLVRTKGYTLADVRDTLKNAGYEVGEKALRDIIREAESKKPSRRSSSKTAPKKTDSGRKDGIDMNNN